MLLIIFQAIIFKSGYYNLNTQGMNSGFIKFASDTKVDQMLDVN